MTARILKFTPQSRIEALRARHAILANRIQDLQKTPASSEFYMKQLKKQKLIIKEEIEGIRAQSLNEKNGEHAEA